MRTARSRTSGEKRFDFLLMAPSSQSVEPPQNSGRFIKPPEYYASKAKKDAEQIFIDELRREKVSLDKARERVSKSLSMSGPKVDPKNFEAEIAQLTNEITALNLKQETLRDQAVKERELLSSINLQNKLAEEALKVYESDSAFIRSEPRDAIVCPVCNAEHENSFLDLLTYAEDARSLRDITVRLRADAREVESRLSKTQGQINELAAHYRKVSDLLATRRGDMQFTQVVDSMGAERAFTAFEQERAVLEKELGERLLTQERLSAEMDKLTDRARSKEILKTFREAYTSALIALNLPATDTSKARLNSRPEISGSGGAALGARLLRRALGRLLRPDGIISGTACGRLSKPAGARRHQPSQNHPVYLRAATEAGSADS
jgi:hypothetical protein